MFCGDGRVNYISALICAVIILCVAVHAREHKPLPPFPDHVELARHTYFDFGPPNDFYELYLIRGTTTGTSIERITFTPPGGSCMQPAKVDAAKGSLDEPIEVLLNRANPCSISDDEINRELKRCRKCRVFSFANITMQVQCGPQTRIIRANVLDKDIFDPSAKTPKQTSWTMQLLDRLDRAVGTGVMDQPAFPASGSPGSAPVHSPALDAVSEGDYDALFLGAPHKPSQLYRMAQIAVPTPDIEIRLDGPAKADKLVAPIYPPLARLAHVEGTVSLQFKIDQDGGTTAVTIAAGHPLLRGTVLKAVSEWRFPKTAV